MRAVQATPDGRTDPASTSLPAFPAGEQNTTRVVDLITHRIAAAMRSCVLCMDDEDSDDPSSADLLHAIIDGLERYVWMARAENHTT